MSIFELFKQRSEEKKSFTEEDFWEAIAFIDVEYNGDTEALLSTLIRHLEEQSDEYIFAFDEKLAELMYTLDGKEWADEIYPKGERLTDSGFRSARCNAISYGKQHYLDVLSHKAAMEEITGTDELLVAGAEAWARKHTRPMEEYPHKCKFSTKTGSNVIKWE
ncbi:MAG: DUF4240 domain-containing protein [Huintestinicola sp.]